MNKNDASFIKYLAINAKLPKLENDEDEHPTQLLFQKIVEEIGKVKSQGYLCKDCGTSFNTYKNLSNHMTRKHKGVGKKHTCHECGKQFSCGYTLKTHINANHSKANAYSCEICVKQFSNGHTLKTHINANHSRAKAYSCNICGKTFLRQTSLNDHMNRHRGIRFYCGYCSTNYGEKRALMSHISSSHPGLEPIFEKKSKFENPVQFE